MSDMDDRIVEDGITLTDAQKQGIAEGMQWVKNWYEKRHEAGMFLDGKDVGLDVQEYQTAMTNLHDLKIVATTDLYDSVEKMIMEGKLHLKDEVVAQCGGDEKEAIAAMHMVNQNKKSKPTYAKMAGCHCNYVKEPVLFLNIPLLEEESKNPDAPSFSNTVAHEITHTLGLQLNEAMTGQILADGVREPGVEIDPYLDNPTEVYARVKEFCKSFNVDPTREITVDEVKKIREECEKKRAEYEQNGGEPPKDLDHHILDRYPDEKIVELINYTAMNDEKEALPNGYEIFRASARADLALSRYKISAAERTVQSSDNVAQVSEQKSAPDNLVHQAFNRDKQYS